MLTVRIEVHPDLRHHVAGADHVIVEATNVGEALDVLSAESSFTPIIFAWLGQRPPGVAVFRNKELIHGRYSTKPLRDGDVLRLVPTM